MRHFLATAMIIVLSLGGTLGGVGVAWAGFDEGVAAYEKRDFKTALGELLPLAEQGHAQAQLYLGNMYRGAAGVPRDDKEAERWIRLAAEQGDQDAQMQIGWSYAPTHTAPGDIIEALKWWNLAAIQGNPGAQYLIGAMYAQGKYVQKNKVLALMWYNLSVIHGNKELNEALDNALQELTSEEFSEVERLSKEWMAEHDGTVQRAADWWANGGVRRWWNEQ